MVRGGGNLVLREAGKEQDVLNSMRQDQISVTTVKLSYLTSRDAKGLRTISFVCFIVSVWSLNP